MGDVKKYLQTYRDLVIYIVIESSEEHSLRIGWQSLVIDWQSLVIGSLSYVRRKCS